MGTNLAQASKEMDDIATMIHKEVDKVTKELVETIYDILTGSPPYGTPIDTGWASANWMINAGMPTPGTVADEGSASTAKKNSQNSLATFLNSDLSGVDSIYIDNRVSYIDKLNNGTSDQSPRDFVELAVSIGRALLTRKRIR